MRRWTASSSGTVRRRGRRDGRRGVGGEAVDAVVVVAAERPRRGTGRAPSRPTAAPRADHDALGQLLLLLDLGLLLVLELAVRLLPLALLGAHEGRRLPVRPARAAGRRPGRGERRGYARRVAIVRMFAAAREAAGTGRDELPGDTVGDVLAAPPWSATARRSPTCCRRAGSGSTATRPSRRRRSGRPTRSPCCRPCREARRERRLRRAQPRRAPRAAARAAGARRRRLLRAPRRPGPRRPGPRRAGPARRRRRAGARRPTCATCSATACSARPTARRGRPRTSATTRAARSSTGCAPSAASAASPSSRTSAVAELAAALDAFEGEVSARAPRGVRRARRPVRGARAALPRAGPAGGRRVVTRADARRPPPGARGPRRRAG